MSEELKPCPFCGGRPLEIDFAGEWPGVLCVTCNVSAVWVAESPAEPWNRRAVEERLRAEIDAAKAIQRTAEGNCDAAHANALNAGTDLAIARREVERLRAKVEWLEASAELNDCGSEVIAKGLQSRMEALEARYPELAL